MTDSASNLSPKNNPPDGRSFASKAKKRAQYNAKFSIGDKVWMKNPINGVFEWVMIVTLKNYDEANEEWEYKLKNLNDIEYGDGSWVAEDDLEDATGSTQR